ncbi:MAG: hypothetical protein ABEK04_00530 [Candidatus Nanohalobium sp.]
MTAEMIRNRDKRKLLRSSFFNTVGYWRKVLAMTFLMLTIIFVTAAPAAIGFMAFYLTKQVLYATLGLAVSITSILVVGFLIYFLPISVLSENSFISGVKNSATTSIENRQEVVMLMIFSFGLFGLAFLSQGVLRKLGFAAFILGRLLSATVTTYTFVVSPNYYLKDKENEGDVEEDED